MASATAPTINLRVTAVLQKLTNGQKTPKEQALEILAKAKSGTWKKDAARIHEILAAL